MRTRSIALLVTLLTVGLGARRAPSSTTRAA
jgi:hypothetical protein